MRYIFIIRGILCFFLMVFVFFASMTQISKIAHQAYTMATGETAVGSVVNTEGGLKQYGGLSTTTAYAPVIQFKDKLGVTQNFTEYHITVSYEDDMRKGAIYPVAYNPAQPKETAVVDEPSLLIWPITSPLILLAMSIMIFLKLFLPMITDWRQQRLKALKIRTLSQR